MNYVQILWMMVIDMNRLLEQINEILKLEIDGNDTLEIWRKDLIYRIVVQDDGWDNVQEQLYSILLDNDRTKDEYSVIAQVFWDAIADKHIIDKNKLVALLNYRLNSVDHIYEDNLVWSITCELYHLDYCNSEYNTLRDVKIIKLLNDFGFIINE